MGSVQMMDNTLSLAGIYEVSKILSSSLDLERSLHDVLKVLSSFLQMRHGIVTLVEKNEPVVVAAADMGQQAVRRGEARILRPLVSQILSTGMAVVVPDIANDPQYADEARASQSIDDETISAIGVPIKTNAQTVGSLTVERIWDGNNRFVFEADLRLLTMVANLIGQTVRLHNSVASDRELLLAEQRRLDKAAAPTRTAKGQGIDNVIGTSPRMNEVFAQIDKVAPTKSTVLLRGESGTGKELFARALHARSPRKDAPFVKVNCAALPENLLESELFGHEKGSFTGASQERKGRFELAHTGTLFLDEIGEISLPFQAKLLRALQEGEFERVGGNRTIKVDIRLITATNKDLEQAVADGSFRADLYYRISVVPIMLPPLRERPGDIPLLANTFLKRFNEENGRSLRFSSDAIDVLQSCAFPGNVRELENCVNRLATLTHGEVVHNTDLACSKNQCLSSTLWKHRGPSGTGARPVGGLGNEFFEEDHSTSTGGGTPLGQWSAPHPMPTQPLPLPCDVSHADTRGTATDPDDLDQRDRLIQAMEKAGWVQAKAARLLGLTPRQIGYALKKHNIEMKQL